MNLNLTCDDTQLKELETVLFQQEFLERPCGDRIILETKTQSYSYSLREEFGKWYIVTE